MQTTRHLVGLAARAVALCSLAAFTTQAQAATAFEACPLPPAMAPPEATPFDGELQLDQWRQWKTVSLELENDQTVCQPGGWVNLNFLVHADLTRDVKPGGEREYRLLVMSAEVNGQRFALDSGPLILVEEIWSKENRLQERRVNRSGLDRLATPLPPNVKLEFDSANLDDILNPHLTLAMGPVDANKIIPGDAGGGAKGKQLDCAVTGTTRMGDAGYAVAACRPSQVQNVGERPFAVNYAFYGLFGTGSAGDWEANYLSVSRFETGKTQEPAAMIMRVRMRFKER